MNKQWLNWLDFAVKCFIVVFTLYLLMSAFFIQESKRMAQAIDSIDKKVHILDQQINLAMTLFTTNNPEFLYFHALNDEQRGDRTEAAKKIIRAAQLSEMNYKKYIQKLADLKSGDSPQ